MARRPLSENEILAQIPGAKARAARSRKRGLRAISVKYDAQSKRVVMETTTGHLFGFPVAAIPSLRDARAEDLRQVELTPSGSGLHWDNLDVDLDVPALILSVLGRQERVRELARAAGSVTSEKKAAAAKANGAKGGRPSLRRLERTSPTPGIKVHEEPLHAFRVAAATQTKVGSGKKSSVARPVTTSTKVAKRSGTGTHKR